MDSTTLKIGELEEEARQLTLENKKELQPKLSKDAPGVKAEPEEEQVEDDENLPEPQALNPYGVFPELVWLKISSKVEDSQDWQNLYSSSSKMMNLLEDEKVERTFPLIFPHVLKYLKRERKEVINLCKACSKFASGIVSWAKRQCLDPYWANEGWMWTYSYPSDEFPMYHVNSQAKLRQLTEELWEGGNFIIPFGIIFNEENWKEVDYWELVKMFLEVFGSRIWLCKFIFNDDAISDNIRLPDRITQCLCLIPNVIRLELDLTKELNLLSNPFWKENPPVIPVPHLSKLKVLSLVKRKQENFMDFLRLHADQLESLSIQGAHVPEESFRYSKLKKLHLTDSPLTSARFRLDSFAQARVTKLYTKIRAQDIAEFGRTFLQFNQFGGSLETLELNVRIDHEEENDMRWVFNIHLPKLRDLAMRNYRGGLPFQLRIPSIQELKLSDFCYVNDRNIWFDLNIWTQLSNLQKVKLYNRFGERTSTFTREEYNQYRENPLNGQ